MKCPVCKREGAYIRRKKKEIVCRFCGAVSDWGGDLGGEKFDNIIDTNKSV